jgi:hypothetical protein
MQHRVAENRRPHPEALHQHALNPNPMRLEAQFMLAVGERIVAENNISRDGVWHLSRSGELLAVVDWKHRTVALRRNGERTDITHAQSKWSHRPEAAGAVSGDFDSVGLESVLWLTAQTHTDLRLPDALRDAGLTLKRMPRVPMRWLKDRQLVLIETLMAGSIDLGDLQTLFPSAAQHMESDLVGLWWCGALTKGRD